MADELDGMMMLDMFAEFDECDGMAGGAPMLGSKCAWGMADEMDDCDWGMADELDNCDWPVGARCASPQLAPKKGTANAARVSRGSEHDVWSGLSVVDPDRNGSEHVTITVVIYNTIADGVPSEEDIVAAIDDLEALYAACGADGRLADDTFDFMKKELTIKDAMDIHTKVTTQPYKPPAVAVTNASVFPS